MTVTEMWLDTRINTINLWDAMLYKGLDFNVRLDFQ